LNYKWIGREDRLKEVLVGQASRLSPASQGSEADAAPVPRKAAWPAALNEISEKLKAATPGSVAIIASARQTNEELFLLKKLAAKLGAVTDSVPREGEADKLLVVADRNPNTNGARLTGICFTEIGIKLPEIARGIRDGKIKTLIVFGEDVTKQGFTPEDLAKLELLVVSDIFPNETTKAAHYLLPGCAHAEKRGSFTNTKGRVQKFMKAVEPPGDARPESESLCKLVTVVTSEQLPATIEGLFNQMAREVPEFNGLTWANLGDTGATVKI
jgi:NADH-quinone oxidoreductase subunit G